MYHLSEYQRHKLCGYLLFFLTTVVIVLTVLMVFSDLVKMGVIR